jgi:hypothetical protein
MWFEEGRLAQGLPPEWFARVLEFANANADLFQALSLAFQAMNAINRFSSRV